MFFVRNSSAIITSFVLIKFDGKNSERENDNMHYRAFKNYNTVNSNNASRISSKDKKKPSQSYKIRDQAKFEVSVSFFTLNTTHTQTLILLVYTHV